MLQVKPRMLPGTDIPWPPTQDELPFDDGQPMPTHRHVLQMTLLMESLRLHWADRPDVFIGGDMFIYYSPQQLLTEDFRGPDVFVVLDTPQQRVRKSWVIWEEEKGPDLVIELLSESTAARDKTEKKLIYQDHMRVPEYVWYDPIPPDEQGRLVSRRLGLLLARWEGEYGREQATWLSWAKPDGTLLPTGAELAAAAQQRAGTERDRAKRAERRVVELEARLARLDEQTEGSD